MGLSMGRRIPRLDRTTSAGVGLALATACISGFAIYLNSFAVKEFASPSVFTGFKNTLVGVVLLVVVMRPGPIKEVARLSRRQLVALGSLGLVGGSIPFVLFFEGLVRVGSGNASFIHKTLFLWVAVLAVLFLKERVGRAQWIALGMLLLAQVLMGGPGALKPGLGEAMVLLATFSWTIEVIIAKRLLTDISSSVGASARMSLGAVVLLTYLAMTGKIGMLGDLTAVQWAWGAGTAVVLVGYVSTWYAALKRAPATTVTCVLTVGAPITAALNALAGRPLPQPEQVVGYLVLLVAAGLFIYPLLRSSGRLTPAAAGGV